MMQKGVTFNDFLASLRALCIEIDRGAPRPFYLVHGKQDYFVEWASNNLLAHLLPGEGGSERLVVLDFRQLTPSNARSAFEERGLFGLGSKRVLLLKNPPISSAEVKDLLEQFLTRPAADTVVLITSHREMAAGSPLQKQLPKASAILHAPSIESDGEALPFLSFLATRNVKSKVKASQRILQEVSVRVGLEEPRQLVREMEKLSLYVGNDRAATLEDVCDITTTYPADTAFTLLAHIAAGKPIQALESLNLLLEEKVPHPIILGAIGQEIRRLIQARTALDCGDVSASLVRGGYDQFRRMFNDEQKHALAKRFPPERRDNLFLQHPYALYRSLRQALSLNRGPLVEALEAVVEADFRLKTSTRPEDQTLERLTLDLCRLIAPERAAV